MSETSARAPRPGLAVGSARRRRIAANAWGVDLVDPRRQEETKPLDFLAFAAFGFPALAAPGLGLPVNELLPLALCALCLGRPPTSSRPVPGWFTCLIAAFVGWMFLTSYLHDSLDWRRLLHLVLYGVLCLFIAAGRIHLRSALYGLGCGLALTIVLSLARIGPNAYAGRLTGYLGDPNAGGYVVSALGAVAIGLLVVRPRLRQVLMLLVPLAIIMTFSRTTLLAMSFSLVWLLVGRRVNAFVGLLLTGAMVYVVGHIPPQLKLLGPFADRKGSDELRARIIIQEHADVDRSPLTGAGAGTAHVSIGNDQFFYHSSYLALQREGGLIAQLILLGTMVLLFLLAIRRRRQLRNAWLEAALICVAVCAVNLGEVLLELPASVVMGFLLHHILNPPEATAAPPGRHLVAP
ncbi:hypothetical protein D9V37_15870 [Nocardioides mangrovicus]|uniref:O-antigen ligase domain-containing protein n=1 Tax=Nocardioides mangrovicus TaxID=2478913 RepID=A0A3L8NZ46_9ACTN|nr:hypothetical protein [Nocardioides mangrovicus]RLV47639.1 hypothetical protein D9V37_15870 [Nocardioides mangrovicus]